MRHIKTYKIFESNQIWDLEDICQEIKDESFLVTIKGDKFGEMPSNLDEAKISITNGSRKGTGISGNNFTMIQIMRDFLIRLKDWSKGEGYVMYVQGNGAVIQILDDGRIIKPGCTCTFRYPSFTKLDINFFKN